MPEKKESLYLLEIGPSNSGELSRPLSREAIESWCKENRMGGTVYGPVELLPMAGVFEVGGGWVEQAESSAAIEVPGEDNPILSNPNPSSGSKKKAYGPVRGRANGAKGVTGAGKKQRSGRILEGTRDSSAH